MYSSIITIVALLGLVCGIQAQVGTEWCHSDILQFTSRHSLNISAYSGDWYTHEIGSSDIGNFPVPDWRCARRTLRIPDPEDPLHIVGVDSFINVTTGISYLDQKMIELNATRSPLNSLWKMVSTENVETNIVILFADLEFQQWTVQYSCSIRGPERYRFEVVQAMTRSRTITPELRAFLKALMVGQGFRIGDHYPINQEDCYNY